MSKRKLAQLEKQPAQSSRKSHVTHNGETFPAHGRAKKQAAASSAGNILPFKSYVTQQKLQKTVVLMPKSIKQEEYVDMLLDKSKIVIIATGPAGTGKAQPLFSKIKIPGGWTTMGELKKGSVVSTPDGGSATVIGLFPQGKKQTFDVIFSDGRKTKSCGEHLWEVFNHNSWKMPRIMSLFDIIEYQKSHRGTLSIRMPSVDQCDDVELPIHPYLLGALLGDGSFATKSNIGFSSADDELISKINALLDGDGEFIKVPNSKYDYNFRGINLHRTQGKKGTHQSSLKTCIYEFGLFGTKSDTKFIPDIYMNSSAVQKIQLLQGLLDTDGYASASSNELNYTTSSKLLCDSVVQLVRSIGGQARVSSRIPKFKYKGIVKNGKESFTVTISILNKSELVTLSRKKARLTNNDNRCKNNTISFSEINLSTVEECQCIMIDSKDHLYITDDYVVTHNTMLAVLAAIKAYKEGEISKIIITRPAVGVDDEKHGFLPGTLNEKMEPWTRPIFDVMKEYYTPQEIALMLEDETIEISPLAFLRGRTFKNSWIIFDEAQNSSTNQMKMVLTRLGDNSKMVITGDLNQNDKKFAHDNGLQDFIAMLPKRTSRSIENVHFSNKDIQRHALVAEVLHMYGED